MAFGLPPECEFWSRRDGTIKEWERRQEVQQGILAEAQRLWEEKSRADAAAWRKRVAQGGGDPDCVAPAA